MTTPTAATSPRYDARDKATGQAMYTEDFPIPPGMGFGRVLLSPYSHARILSIDVTQAEHLPGVMAVLTRDHLGALAPYPRNLGAESGVGRLSGGPGQPHQPMTAKTLLLESPDPSRRELTKQHSKRRREPNVKVSPELDFGQHSLL